MGNDSKGTLTITSIAKKQRRKDKNRKFDIFINGPDEKLHKVSLRNGESVELNNLQQGAYSVYAIAPMNYILGGISNKEFTISRDDLYMETTINNIQTYNSWFSSEDINR